MGLKHSVTPLWNSGLILLLGENVVGFVKFWKLAKKTNGTGRNHLINGLQWRPQFRKVTQFCITTAVAFRIRWHIISAPLKGIVTVNALYPAEASEASLPNGGTSSEHYLSVENVILKALCDLKMGLLPYCFLLWEHLSCWTVEKKEKRINAAVPNNRLNNDPVLWICGRHVNECGI